MEIEMIHVKKSGQRAFSLEPVAVRTAAPVTGVAIVATYATQPRIPEQAIANARFNIRREARRIVLQRDSSARAAAFLKAKGATISLRH